MSRTIRRKNEYNRNDNRCVRNWEKRVSKYGGNYYVRIYYEGKEKRKGLARYHSDAYVRGDRCNLYKHASRQLQHKINRARIRHELVLYMKNAEHEVIVRKDPHLHYWN